MKKIIKKVFKKILKRFRNKIKRLEANSEKRNRSIKIYKNLLYLYYQNDTISKAYNAIATFEPNNNYSKKEKKEKVKDILYYKNMYKSATSEYYFFDLPSHTEEEIKDFVFGVQRRKYLRYLNPNILHITKNKYKTYEVYKKYFKRDVELITSTSFKQFNNYLKKHPIFVKKPLDASFGRGVELIDSTNENIKKLFEKLVKENGDFIVEEKIEQGKEMKRLNPSSVNTIRVVPYIKDGKCTVHSPFLKVGQNGSFVDNGGAGGILVALDSNTGVAISDGVDEKLNRYEKHPNTNVKFCGFQVPEWDELKKLAEEVAKVHEGGRYIGFDFAYSTKGWVVVEANGRTQFIGQQMPLNKGIRKDLEELIDWKNVQNKNKYNKKEKIKDEVDE